MHGKGLPVALLIAAIGLVPATGYSQGRRGGMARSGANRSAPRFSGARPTANFSRMRPTGTFSGVRPTGSFSRFNGNSSFRNSGSVRSASNWRSANANWVHNNRNWNGNWNNWRRHHHHDSFIFFGGFGWPWYYSYYDYYPAAYYYPYYPYGYYPYGPDGYYSGDYYPNAPYSDGSGYYDDRSSDRGYYDQNGGSQRQSVVARVQEELARAGYYRGAIDGVAGDRTYYAIRAYERDHHLHVDGAISDQLLSEMGLR